MNCCCVCLETSSRSQPEGSSPRLCLYLQVEKLECCFYCTNPLYCHGKRWLVGGMGWDSNGNETVFLPIPIPVPQEKNEPAVGIRVGVGLESGFGGRPLLKEEPRPTFSSFILPTAAPSPFSLLFSFLCVENPGFSQCKSEFTSLERHRLKNQSSAELPNNPEVPGI